MKLGRFPASKGADLALLETQQKLLDSITPPVSDEEARKLVKVFGPDDYYGLAWTVLHLAEKAPDWPSEDCLTDTENQWVTTLRNRVLKKRNRLRTQSG